MIKNIAKIKGLGVYDNYIKPVGTKDFGVRNLIYGWNYSGKTTLSRLFAQLETKRKNPDLAGSEFTFETAGDSINEKNFHESSLIVRVFNSEFIRDNLHFEGSAFNPILLLGKESDEAQKNIDARTKRLGRSEVARRSISSRAALLTQTIASGKTEAARQIRQLLKLDPYNAGHLSNDIQIVQILDQQPISETQLSEDLELALTPDNKRPNSLDPIQIKLEYSSLYEEAVPRLSSTPSFSHTLKHLDENPQVEEWIALGMRFHRDNEACEFCGNIVHLDRLNELRAHFSKDLEEHRNAISDLHSRVVAARLNIKMPKSNDLNAQCRTKFELATASLPTAIDEYNRAIDTLAQSIALKGASLRKPIQLVPLADVWTSAVESKIAEINAVIDENNAIAENFGSARKEASDRVRKYHVQQYLIAAVATRNEQKLSSLSKRVAMLTGFEQRIKGEIADLQAQISRAQNGREAINDRLGRMLGAEAVQIEVVREQGGDQERFRLVRKNGRIAKNLSDGERTAIAFSYFLTKLEELSAEDFRKAIVYIDDPISSLDANHIFQVNAAIRAVFCRQDVENGPWLVNCGQLFVSTHNFEFFHLLRELRPEGQLFLLKRTGQISSTFGNMPPSLAKYQSEYHYLFELIHQFHKADDKSDHSLLMLLPNAVRRFVELYTYSRIPGKKDDTVDRRAEKLFGVEKSKRILKVLHHFSHANTIDRLIGNSELIFDIENAITDLFEEINRTDQKHMQALLESVAP